MTKNEKADLLVNAMRMADIEVRSYSGRGMYGKTCIGIDLNPWAVACVISNSLNSDQDGIFLSDFSEPKTDRMGLGTITYFPDLPWDDSYNVDSHQDEIDDAENNHGQ